MSHEIKIPNAGESVTSALVANWHKEEGDSVQKGDNLVTLETDKVSTELEAEISGILSITVQEGEEVGIGSVIGLIAEGAAENSSQDIPKQEKTPASVTSGNSAGEIIPVKVPAAGESITSATVAAWNVSDGSFVKKGEVLVSLDTDKVSSDLEAEASGTIKIDIAEGNEVEIGTVLAHITTGVGPDDNATTEPKKIQLEQDGAQKVSSDPVLTEIKSEPVPTQSPAAAADNNSRVVRKKMSPLRRKIAQHLVNAQQTAAILSTFNEVDMSAIMKLRKQVQEDFVAKHGVKLGFMSFFVKATVQALKEVPSINARIDGTDVIENQFFDIGVAIGTEKGLVVPILRDCEQKSFAQIEQDIIDYAMKARDGKIEFSDLSGGVFTVSNGGVYGSLLSTPILNPPQSGILGMHTIQQRPIAENGEVVIRPMMYLALSYDHRLVDGKEAVTFLLKIKEGIENPHRLMLEM